MSTLRHFVHSVKTTARPRLPVRLGAARSDAERLGAVRSDAVRCDPARSVEEVPHGGTERRGPRRRASDRGKYGRLSRERVLAAALEVVDREGLSALSMRRLGAELGVEAMALYRYAPSKDALLDGLVEALYTEIGEVLAADAEQRGGPRAELRGTAVATYRVALAHPHVVPLLATRILSVPLARRPTPCSGSTNGCSPCSPTPGCRSPRRRPPTAR
ncbi:TetR/AcrR family transcriptional regulator [Streptomyces zhihengii]